MSFTVGRRLVFFLIRWANDTFESEFPVITTILVIMGAMALTTHLIGVHTVLGAFVAGVLIGELPILTQHIDEQLRGLIVAFFMPVFFGIAGLSADLTVLTDPHLLLLALGLIAIASIGKFAGAFIGGRDRRPDRREALALGLRHECARLDRGDRRHHRPVDGRAHPEPVHDDRRDGGRHHHGDAADAALGAGAGADAQGGEGTAGARGVRSQGLRLQTSSACCSPSTTARTASSPRGSPGLIAGPARHADHRPAAATSPRPAGPDRHAERQTEDEASSTRRTKKPRDGRLRGSRRAARDPGRSGRRRRRPVAITVRSLDDKPAEEAIASRSQEGLRPAGHRVEKTMRDARAAFTGRSAHRHGLRGTARDRRRRETHLADPQQCPTHILVPVTGTDVSRRAAEVAIAIARACNCPVTALYVAVRHEPQARAAAVRATSRSMPS